MGTVYKKTATKPLPPGANIIVRKGRRFAEWLDANKNAERHPLLSVRTGPTELQ
jgi:hypothetical protein